MNKDQALKVKLGLEGGIASPPIQPRHKIGSHRRPAKDRNSSILVVLPKLMETRKVATARQATPRSVTAWKLKIPILPTA